MAVNESEMRRLSFIKYLKKKADEASIGPAPNPSASILTLHDSVELYLYLAAEHLNVSKPTNIKFMEYWGRISPKLSEEEELSHKESMERLNRARRNLKHAGNRPHESDVISYRIATDEFFRENTPKIFDIDFDGISLVSLIEFDETRDYLEEAEEARNNNQFDKALELCAIAFQSMLREMKKFSRKELGYSPFYSNRGHRSSYMGSMRSGGYNTSIWAANYEDNLARTLGSLSSKVNDLGIEVSDLSDEVEKISRDLGTIEGELEVISLGIDYMEYSRFRHVTPNVVVSVSGETLVRSDAEDEFINDEEANYCLNFVIESTLKVQDLVFLNAG